MVLYLYSNKEYEYQAISCIKTLEKKIKNDIKIVYYTIGFKSNYVFNNVYKVELDYRNYPTFHYYKAELALLTMELFPEEEHFIFSDTDILYSKRFDFEKLKHNYEYPLASLGPHEYPFIYEQVGDDAIFYNENKLLAYTNVSGRTMTYVWSCFFSYNRKCLDFLEEYTSFCNNQYLLKRRKDYYPFQDETSFNVLLWKRNANKNLGYAFVNTHSTETIKEVEQYDIKNKMGNNVDKWGANWEYVHDSSNILFYHGVKEKDSLDIALNYILNE